MFVMSLEEITRAGELYYLSDLRGTLEKEHFGEYVVIDVEEKRYVTDIDRLAAFEKARKEFGQKIFYVTQVGMLREPTLNYLDKRHAWNF